MASASLLMPGAARRSGLLAMVALLALLSASCGAGLALIATSGGQVTVSLSGSNLTVTQDGTPATINFTVTSSAGTGSVTVSVISSPAGVTSQVSALGADGSGSITFTATPAAASGSSTVTVEASSATASARSTFTLVVAIVDTVSSTVNTSAGLDGRLSTFMSTSFQPADYDFNFFMLNSGATTTLGNLLPQHVRLQPIDGATPQLADKSWDFAELNDILEPVASVADHSPEFQIAVAPAWMTDSSGHLLASHFADFAAYSADLVEYYNTSPGFTDSQGKIQAHTPFTPITWWGIFNEPNINGISAGDYVTLYNDVVPAMQAASSDVPIKFVAVELADFSNEPQNYLPSFVAGVKAHVDAVATHYYSSCNQKDSDQTVMNTIPGFVDHVKFIESELASNPALASVPVWVTENNVNADYDKGGGISACNGTPFIPDLRGSSSFFAAWRPYVFSQLAQAGVQSLYHWDFGADIQFGEVDFSTDKTQLSYWVDYELARYFPSPPGANILTLNATETSSVETLAVRNDDGSVVVMVVNHAVHSAADDNGAGDPRTVIVDVSALGTFSSASQLTIDASTDSVNGPTASNLTVSPRLTVTLGGYGVTFLKLTP
jgi:hypothetical protein